MVKHKIQWKDVEGMCRGFAHTFLFKVKSFGYEYNDLFHDCYIKYNTICNLYPNLEDLSDFKKILNKALVNMVVDIQRQIQYQEEYVIYYNDYDNEEYFLASPQDIEFKYLVKNAPSNIKRSLGVVYDAIGTRDCRITNNFLCKKLGLNRNTHKNVLNDLRNYFSSF